MSTPLRIYSLLLLCTFLSYSCANYKSPERVLKLLEDSRYHYIPTGTSSHEKERTRKIEFVFRSHNDDATLLHMQGDHEFATFTLASGLLHLFLRDSKGNPVEFLSSHENSFSDWKWHKVVVSAESDLLRLTIDDDQRFIVGRHSLGTYGGVFVAADRGQTCVANAILNDEEQLTMRLQADLCADADTSNNGTDNADLLMSDPSVPMSIQPVYINEPIAVREGASAQLSIQNMYIFPQHLRYGLQNRNVIFRIVGQPQHGKLVRGNTPVRQQFTYEDVFRKTINYTHDGSETREDAVDLEVEFRNLDASAPAALKHSYSYTLTVRVTPVNDPPQIKLPNGPVIELAQSARIKFGQEHMMVADPDNPPAEVTLKVVYSNPSGAAFERVDQPGAALTEFSQEELIADQIRLRHISALESSISVVATDKLGESASQPLTVKANPVQFRLINKTGLKVLHKSSEVITTANLSFVSNVANNGHTDIVYKIVKIPECGFVEAEDDSGRWWITPSFNQSDIDRHRVRYRHAKIESTPSGDSFRFQVSADNATSAVVYEFKITFVPVNIKVFSPTPFVLNNSQLAYLSRDHLFAWTFPKASSVERLVYHVTSPPKYGFLYRVINPTSGRRRRLGLYSNFTQADIDAGDIFYQLHFVHYTLLNDQFRFKVVAPFVSSDQLQFDITFKPGKSGIRLINRTLIVTEGQLHKLVNTTLFLETPDDKDFEFTIVIPPTRGEFLQYTSTSMGATQLNKGANFSTDDLNLGKVYYRHDGSETTTDKAFIIARPMHRNSPADAKIPFWFTVRIVLENDHAPQRTHEDIFHIVFRGERIMTKSDLEFTDEDSDFDSLKLTYYFTGEYKEGGIYWVTTSDVAVYNFTQNDINQRRLLFRHTGKRRLFQLAFFVSDGHKLTKSYLDINASEPFLRLRRNTGIVVDQGGLIAITAANLTCDTNMNIGPSGITYELLNNTSVRGRLMVMLAGERAARRIFTQRQINSGRVIYSEDQGQGARRETLTLQVQAATLKIFVKLDVVVRTKPDTLLLQIVPLHQLTVPSGGIGAINAHVLKATHPHYASRSIHYNILEFPQYGKIILESSSREKSDYAGDSGTVRVTQFSQFEVDRGHVQYMHTGELVDDRQHDSIQFNVSAGDETIGPLELAIEIRSNQINLETGNFTAAVAARTRLPRDVVRASSTYYASATFVFLIVQLPRHGFIETQDGSAVTRFTENQLSGGSLYYTHDMSSSWTDELVVQAIMQGGDGEMEAKSQPELVHISIRHKNERGPELVHNVPLQMWGSTAAPIISNLLRHTDLDTPPSELIYFVSAPKGGYVALALQSAAPINNFTQADLDSNRIVFVRHESGNSGGFSFIVTDGKHQVGPNWFSVEAVDLNLALEANAKLVLAPGGEAVIGIDLLRAKLPSVQLWEIQFTVVKPPKYGTVFVRGRPTNRFSQLDVNQRSVTYAQNRVMPRAWHLKDAFLFRITVNGSAGLSSPPEIEMERRFKILLTYAALADDELPRYVARQSLVLSLGSSLVINSTYLNTSALSKVTDESLLMSVVREPRLGLLEFASNNLTDFSSLKITQSDINGNMLVYNQMITKHTGSLPLEDHISFQIFPASQLFSRKRSNRLEFQLPLEIVAAPDPGAFMIRNCPEELRLVRGTTVVLKPQMLLTEVLDVAPSNVVYEVIQGPLGGYFQHRKTDDIDEEGGTALSPHGLLSFTQAAVNKQRVEFVQDGNAKLGVFTLTVRTPRVRHPRVSRVVRVRVSPLTLSLINHTAVELKQGETSVVVDRRHLGTDSNGPTDSIIYHITKQPQNGSLIWKATKRQADRFSQLDINKRKIFYAQSNLKAWQDSFVFVVSNAHIRISDKLLNVFVQPNVVQIPFVKVEPGGSFVLTEQFLDASALKDKAPRFLVIRAPKHGRLIIQRTKTVRAVRESGLLEDVKNETQRSSLVDKALNDNGREITTTISDVTFFTFEDIKMGLIRYLNTMQATDEMTMVEDSFEYELHATGVQPARAVFSIHIQPSNYYKEPDLTDTDNTQLLPTRPPRTPPPGDSTLTLPNITQGYTWAIVVIIAIALAALIIIILRRLRIKCKRERQFLKEKRQELKAQHSSFEIPTPQPDLLGTTVYADSTGKKRRTATIHRSNGGGGGSSSAYTSDSGVGMSQSVTLDGRTNCRTSAQHISPPYYSSSSTNASKAAAGDASGQRMITFDAGRTELISSVPMCKVTPLTPRPGSAGGAVPTTMFRSTDASGGSSSDDWRYAYHYSSSATSDTELKADRMSLDRATGVRNKRGKTSTSSLQQSYTAGVKQPTKLKEHQYWV